MAAPLNVNREEVRMLVLELGYAETSRRTGLNVNTLRQWGSRFGWLEHIKNPGPLPKSMQPTAVIGVTKPVDALINALMEHGNATKLAVMRYAKNTSEHAARMSEDDPDKALAAANDVKAVVQTAAIAGSWAAAGGTQVNVAVLLGGDPAGS